MTRKRTSKNKREKQNKYYAIINTRWNYEN